MGASTRLGARFRMGYPNGIMRTIVLDQDVNHLVLSKQTTINLGLVDYQKWQSCSNSKYTVKSGNSKPVDDKLQDSVYLLLPTKISNHSINHMIDSKCLAIVNIFALFKKFTKASFQCTWQNTNI